VKADITSYGDPDGYAMFAKGIQRMEREVQEGLGLTNPHPD